MNQIRFQQVWFTDEKRNRSITKLIMLTDSGVLEARPDSLQFRGRKLNFHISSIKDVSLARQQINWVTYLIVNILAIIYLAFMAKAFPELYSFSFLLLLLVAGNVFGLVVGYNTKWVKVEYADESHRTIQAFFADGSSLGWGGIFGGTEKMYKALKALTNQDQRATS
jgi:hypothetical protein